MSKLKNSNWRNMIPGVIPGQEEIQRDAFDKHLGREAVTQPPQTDQERLGQEKVDLYLRAALGDENFSPFDDRGYEILLKIIELAEEGALTEELNKSKPAKTLAWRRMSDCSPERLGLYLVESADYETKLIYWGGKEQGWYRAHDGENVERLNFHDTEYISYIPVSEIKDYVINSYALYRHPLMRDQEYLVMWSSSDGYVMQVARYEYDDWLYEYRIEFGMPDYYVPLSRLVGLPRENK